jgi:hypothetical protein
LTPEQLVQLAPLIRDAMLLGHASIQTTGDIYTDWDVDQLAATMADVLDDDRPTDNEANPKSFPLNSRKRLQMRVYT